MKEVTVRFTTTEANQDVLTDFIKPAITAFIPNTTTTYEIDFDLLFESDYAGNITIADAEIGSVVSKATAKRSFTYQGSITAITIETTATAMEATLRL